ncbi:MAG: hypothetical protein ACO3EE_08540 [Flavobacteriales bacterium]
MKHFLKYIALFIVVISISSCAKETQQKLVGKWKMFVVPAKEYNEIWTFTETSVSRSYEFPDSTIVQNSGDYEMTGSKSFNISGPNTTMVGVEYLKGDWKIKDIDTKGLVIYRQDIGTVYYEFEKQ